MVQFLTTVECQIDSTANLIKEDEKQKTFQAAKRKEGKQTEKAAKCGHIFLPAGALYGYATYSRKDKEQQVTKHPVCGFHANSTPCVQDANVKGRPCIGFVILVLSWLAALPMMGKTIPLLCVDF